MKAKLFLSLILLFFIVNYCFTQTYRGQEAKDIIHNTDLVKFKNYSKVPNYFRFSENTTHSEQETIEIIKSFIKNSNSDLQLKKVQNQGDGTQTLRYYQTVHGFPIEFSALNLQFKNNKVTEINGEILDNPDINPNFIISETEALQLALNFVNAKQYMWEDAHDYFPKGEKVIVPNKINFDNSLLKSAWKFEIYSKNPYNRQMIYVDAENGDIILDYPLIHFTGTNGTAQTAYYDEQPITMNYNGSQYILHDDTRGNGIRTYDCHNTASYNSATDFYNNTTNWDNTPYGTDAHFSSIMTYDYYLQKHGYNSINNAGFQLKSYVHFNLKQYGYPNNINAFWDGQRMTYGDGEPSQGITPLTTIDICGHEITHGLTEFTGGLIYAQESGALNEGFSDIFGTAIEFFGVPEHANWLCGEKIGMVIRSLENPKAYGDPSTYKGTYWDFATQEVHKNSTVFSHWFYLVSEGKSGTNDFGNSYNVTGIGISKAEQIAFKLLTQYLTPSSGYEDACFYGLQAAAAIFGACSDEVKSVGDAFYAIGVLQQPYENQAVADFITNVNESCSFPITVQFKNQSYNCDNYVWDFGDDSPASTLKNPTHTYNNNGNYTVTLIGDGGVCGTDTKIKQDYIKISPDLPCTYYMTQGVQNIENCSGIVYDNGGPNGNYSDNLKSQLIIYAPNSLSITLNFIQFEVEAGGANCSYDYLSVYAGNGISSSTLVGKYCNSHRPPDNSVTVNGEYVTLYFVSDGAVNLAGFKIEFLCTAANVPPTTQFDADKTNSCDGIINFTDKSMGAKARTWLWDFGDGGTSILQHPTHQYYENGEYTVTLTAGNEFGDNSLTKTNYIVIENMDYMDNHQFEIYNTLPFELYIPDASENLKWYDNNEDNLWETTPVFTGNPIQHPAISEDKIYYILDSYEGEKYHVGEKTCNVNGNFYNSTIVYYLIFDAYQNFELKSVLVNANSAGDRQIMLRDSNENMIWTKSVYIQKGVSRIIIDKFIQKGSNLQLACQSNPNLYRSNANASLKYPYTVEDIVSIKTSNGGSNFYYYFYDWEIKLPDCNSELATVTISQNIGIQENILQNITISPNPTTGQLKIEITGQARNDINNVEIFDVYGRKLSSHHLITSSSHHQIDISHLQAGIYFVRISTDAGEIVKKVVKN